MFTQTSDRPVLVTGATGFAGGHLIEHLAAAGPVVGWGRSTPIAELRDMAVWQIVDLLDRDGVRTAISALQPTAVYHLAGASQVAESWRDATTALEGNVWATTHLLDAIRRARLDCRILLTSSSAVYAPSQTPIQETAPLAPVSPYALSKLAQERLALRAFAEDGVNVIVVRPFNHTGPRQTPAFVAPAFARQIALIERGRLDPVIRVGNLEPRRDLTDVRDVVRAYVALMARGRAGEIYNVGSGVALTIRSLLDALLSRTTASVRLEADPSRLRSIETPALVADFTRLRDATGWAPRVPFERMLDDLLGYWREQVGSSKFEVQK